jgi:gluconokinase
MNLALVHDQDAEIAPSPTHRHVAEMQTGPKRLPNVIVVMGVAGAGKTLVGKTLARAIGWAFYDADDFHSRANIEKMSRGEPLTDDDRRPWLAAMRVTIAGVIERADHGVLACSALKEWYRRALVPEDAPPGAVRFVYLDVPESVLHGRLARVSASRCSIRRSPTERTRRSARGSDFSARGVARRCRTRHGPETGNGDRGRPGRSGGLRSPVRRRRFVVR